MKSTVILAAILADLQTYATTLKGKCDMRSVLAKDPFHAMEILCTAPTGHYLIVQDDGDAETPGTDSRVDVILRQAFSVFVSFNHGLKATPAGDLLEDRGDRPSLTELCDLIRARVQTKGQQVDADNNVQRPHYLGRLAVATPDAIPLGAYRLRFEIDYAADALTFRDP